jgi:hypothetical protein
MRRSPINRSVRNSYSLDPPLIGTDCTGSCKSNYLTITTTTAPPPPQICGTDSSRGAACNRNYFCDTVCHYMRQVGSQNYLLTSYTGIVLLMSSITFPIYHLGRFYRWIYRFDHKVSLLLSRTVNYP